MPDRPLPSDGTEDEYREAADRGLIRDKELSERLSYLHKLLTEYNHERVEALLAKAREYDGLDLEIMGTAMQGLLPPGLDAQTRRQAGLEMACNFYALGKLARSFAAYRRGTLPREDSADDFHAYAAILHTIRKTGRWT